MKIFQINGGVFGSTGKIMFGISKAARERGHTVVCASAVTSTNRTAQPQEDYLKIGSYYGRCLSVLLARLSGLEGCFAVLPTIRLIRKIKAFSPDVIHLHSIHNSYINLPMLFRFIKKHKIRVVWTLHDCWAMTGHCPHFEMVGCDKWKSGCYDCPLYREYPKSIRDNSGKMYRKKKKWFTGIEDLTIITPSFWLEGIVRQSFLQSYPVKTIHNGIDLNIFHPQKSEFRDQYQLHDKIIVLGVAFGWNRKKGLDVFVELSKRLDDKYQIVLVGTDDNVDGQLPDRILSIHCTQNQTELAEIYSAADIFVNPTREDTYPTVNMEALGCGTPLVTFATGGSPEIPDETCGSIAEKENIDELENAIRVWGKKTAAESEHCIDRSKAFDMHTKYSQIVQLYENRE